MPQTGLITLLTILAVAVGTISVAPPSRAESIPPNCTMDPFTGKLTCHIWPSCTLDPFTGKMNCPAPKSAIAARAAARAAASR